MEENYQQEPEYLPENNGKKPGFANGVAVGAITMLAVVLLVTSVVFTVVRFSNRNKSESNVTALTGEEENQESTQENILNIDLISEMATINSYLQESYLYDIDMEDLRNGILAGMVEALGDPYSEYYDEEALESFQIATTGEYVGIGAAVTQQISTGVIRISKPYEGTPAIEAGLLPGDILVSVDDVEVTGMDLQQVVNMIKGDEGTSVMLEIFREDENQSYDIEVFRRSVVIPTVAAEMLEDNVGYIQVSSFEAVTDEQFQEKYEELKSQGMERVIIDLRDNGGGLVETVENMLDYLLPEGEIFYAKGKDGVKYMPYNSDANAALDIPLVVLVNEYTASAAEVFSGNIQAFGAGEIVGITTYGKGVMQQTFYTNQEKTKAIKITVGDYYIHSDININGIGITPDVEVELSEEAAKLAVIPQEQDNQLQTAIETVKSLEQ